VVPTKQNSLFGLRKVFAKANRIPGDIAMAFNTGYGNPIEYGLRLPLKGITGV
jgi:hypothetical protein